MRTRSALAALLVAAALVACRNDELPRRGPAASASADRTSLVSTAPSLAPSSTTPPVGSAASAPTRLARPAHESHAIEGDACAVAESAARLPFSGPLLMAPADDGAVRFVFNVDGVAKAALPVAPADADAGVSKPPKATAPACAVANGSFYCLDTKGAIHRQKLGGEGDSVVAKARPGSPMAVSSIGDGHVLVAFLADRATTEGAVTQAFVALDDQTPLLLSEEGSGATFVALAPRGDQVLAAYIDARRALTPVHARVLKATSRLEIGKDVVAFVGEGSDARTACALAGGGENEALALVPIGKDATTFGMAAVRIGDPPKDDAEVVWSTYPNGCTPAPIVTRKGPLPAEVLRVRPSSAEASAKRTLELGRVAAAGGFEALCNVAEGSSFNDLAIAADRDGTLVIAYTDERGTWLERRGGRAAKQKSRAPK